MKMSNGFFLTRREDPSDEFNIASKLLIKSGMVIRNSNGIYSYLPIGYKVVENIKKIIKEELSNVCKAEEVFLPTLTLDDEKEDNIFEEVYQITDRSNNKMKLSHSSNELYMDLVKHKIKSYKDLHFSLYQINRKYRDEKHTEYGLIRMKEFLECDSCSFDSDEGGLDVSYDKMFLAFKNIFSRLGLEPMIVRGDEELFCEEFQIVSEEGDNTVVKCTSCGYTSNIEDATNKSVISRREYIPRERSLVKTPGKKTIKEVSEYLNVFENSILKSLVVKVDGKNKLILLRGNSELNVKKLMKLFHTTNIEIPSEYELKKIGTHAGYIGPINCNLEIIADNEVKLMNNFICGANKENYHYKDVNYGIDFKISRFADLKLFDEESLCPLCKSKCVIVDGIEIGQITKIGHKLSKEYKLTYTDEVNKEQLVEMGSYHIGIDRCLSAVVEKNHDEGGIIWPMSIAPYKVGIIVSNTNHSDMMDFANNLYVKLNELGIDTILDDRKETIGVKFNDMDLIGIPLRVTVGNKLDKGTVEIKLRNEEDSKEIKTNRIVEYIQKIVERNNKKY